MAQQPVGHATLAMSTIWKYLEELFLKRKVALIKSLL